jgi:hypothetical protein
MRQANIIKVLYLLIFNVITLYQIYLQARNNNIVSLNLTPYSNAGEITSKMGISDAGLLLNVALTWSSFSNLQVEQFFTVNFWSPGISLIEIPLIWLESIGIPIFFSMSFLTLFLWNIVFSVHINMIETRLPLLVSFISLILYSFSYDHYWIFNAGLFHTEGIGYGLLSLALLLTFKNLPNLKYFKSVLIGLILGFSILVRYSNEWAIIIAIAFFILLLFISNMKTFEIVNKRKMITSIILIFTTSFVVTVPWRIINHEFYSMSTWKLSAASNELGYMIWAPEGSDSENFWGETGSNWGCRIDQIKCEALNSSNLRNFSNTYLIKEGFSSAGTNPISYLQQRLKYGLIFYFYDKDILNLFYGFLFIFFFLIIVKKVFTSITYLNNIALLIILPFFIVNFFYLTLIHFEARYFFPIKLLIFLSLTFLYRSKTNKSIDNNIIS